MLGEVRLRRGLDAVGVVSVVDGVQVGREDPALRPAVAQLDRQAGLLDLPVEASAPGPCRGCARAAARSSSRPRRPCRRRCRPRARGRCPRSRRRRAGRSAGPRPRPSPSAATGSSARAAPARGFAAAGIEPSSDAVGRVDERVLRRCRPACRLERLQRRRERRAGAEPDEQRRARPGRRRSRPGRCRARRRRRCRRAACACGMWCAHQERVELVGAGHAGSLVAAARIPSLAQAVEHRRAAGRSRPRSTELLGRRPSGARRSSRRRRAPSRSLGRVALERREQRAQVGGRAGRCTVTSASGARAADRRVADRLGRRASRSGSRAGRCRAVVTQV